MIPRQSQTDGRIIVFVAWLVVCLALAALLTQSPGPPAEAGLRGQGIPPMDQGVYLPIILKNYLPSELGTPTPTPTEIILLTPTETPKVAPTGTPSVEPTSTPTRTATPTPTPTPTIVVSGEVIVLSSNAFIVTLGTQTDIHIVGEVRNDATANAESVEVTATFYDGSGTSLGAASSIAYQGILTPGQTSPFKIVESYPPGYDHYTLSLSYGFTMEQPLPPLQPSNWTKYYDACNEWLYFFGEVENTTGQNIEAVQVIATLYDASGRVLNVEDTGLTGVFRDLLEPGGKSPFRLRWTLGPMDYAAPPGWTVIYRTTSQQPPQQPLSVSMGREYVEEKEYTEGPCAGMVVRWQELFGEVENTTEQNVKAVRVIATFYEDGAVINAERGWILNGQDGVLAPGDKAPFQLDVSDGPVDYDTRTLTVAYEPTTEAAPVQAQVPIPPWTSYRETEPIEWLELFGEVQNNTEQNIKSVQIIGTLYDETGMVINAAFTSAFSRILVPGQKSPFKLQLTFGEMDYASSALVVDYHVTNESPVSGLEIINDHAVLGGGLHIQGEVRNNSAHTIRCVEVLATLYDEAGRVLNATREYVEGRDIEAGGTSSFDLKFEGHFTGWDHYAVQAQGRLY
jgi:hypothetical protein